MEKLSTIEERGEGVTNEPQPENTKNLSNMKEIEVTYFPLIFITDNPRLVTLSEILNQIKDPFPKQLNAIENIRKAKSKEESDRLKCLLPSVCFSGQFNKRSTDGLIKFNPIICIDIDDIMNIATEKARIVQFPFVVAAFLSPSGKGLKVVVRHDANDPEQHKPLYEAIGNALGLKGRTDLTFDQHCSDIARACFISYDPDIYINYDATPYHYTPTSPAPTTPTTPTIATTPSTPIDYPTKELEGYEVIREQIKATHTLFEQHYNMHPGTRNQNLFILACFLRKEGIPEQIAIDYLILYYADPSNNFLPNEIERTVKSAYKQ